MRSALLDVRSKARVVGNQLEIGCCKRWLSSLEDGVLQVVKNIQRSSARELSAIFDDSPSFRRSQETCHGIFFYVNELGVGYLKHRSVVRLEETCSKDAVLLEVGSETVECSESVVRHHSLSSPGTVFLNLMHRKGRRAEDHRLFSSQGSCWRHDSVLFLTDTVSTVLRAVVDFCLTIEHVVVHFHCKSFVSAERFSKDKLGAGSKNVVHKGIIRVLNLSSLEEAVHALLVALVS
jgi:hypothetical protein